MQARILSVKTKLPKPYFHQTQAFKKLPSLYLQKFTANLNPETKSRYNEVLEIFKITSKVERDDVSQPKKIEKSIC